MFGARLTRASVSMSSRPSATPMYAGFSNPSGSSSRGSWTCLVHTGLMTTPEGWSEVDGALQREFSFPNFAEALAFVNRVGELAEAENHHPDVELGWGSVLL